MNEWTNHSFYKNFMAYLEWEVATKAELLIIKYLCKRVCRNSLKVENKVS